MKRQRQISNYQLGYIDALYCGITRNPYRASDLRYSQYKRGQRAALATIRHASNWSRVYDHQN